MRSTHVRALRPCSSTAPNENPRQAVGLGRTTPPAEAVDIAAAVRFLCSPGASYINGQNILVNGGTFLG
jgi:NAD(P)-dependent dehydrogenase (short-subunit alcohol dehydrogenase family)